MEAITDIALDALHNEVQTMWDNKYRLVTMTSVDLKDEDKFDVLYHFDKDLSLKTFRVTVPKDTAIPSISGIYFAAFLVENEIKDQFGVNFTDIALDFGCNLYLEDEVMTSPFCKYSITKKDKKG
ncbi:NADH-quinone oxidoreductase subunit C [Desulfovibrio inopinatus]|uniref:NADH-quinone oxidoreductase subunit C n=1 Tax=Desulfovibrio inopinatus TaxID=102109 RepID=UPI000422B537|nr:NADH-quinone oxidoreductase subunit C [Desulfovibrio inopinatus]